MPSIELWYQARTGGVPFSLGTKTDVVTTRALYEAPHAILMTGIAHTIDLATNIYWITIDGESGADYQQGPNRPECISVVAIYKVSQQAEGCG
jgi:hypothetical protein